MIKLTYPEVYHYKITGSFSPTLNLKDLGTAKTRGSQIQLHHRVITPSIVSQQNFENPRPSQTNILTNEVLHENEFSLVPKGKQVTQFFLSTDVGDINKIKGQFQWPKLLQIELGTLLLHFRDIVLYKCTIGVPSGRIVQSIPLTRAMIRKQCSCWFPRTLLPAGTAQCSPSLMP